MGRSLEKKKDSGTLSSLAWRMSWQSWFGSISVQDMGNCYTGQSQEGTAAPGVGPEFWWLVADPTFYGKITEPEQISSPSEASKQKVPTTNQTKHKRAKLV